MDCGRRWEMPWTKLTTPLVFAFGEPSQCQWAGFPRRCQVTQPCDCHVTVVSAERLRGRFSVATQIKTSALFGDLRLVPERVPGAKHMRHPGQDSVDNSFSMKWGLILFVFGQKILAWCSIVRQEGFCSNHSAKECCVWVGDNWCKSHDFPGGIFFWLFWYRMCNIRFDQSQFNKRFCFDCVVPHVQQRRTS